VTQRPDLFEWLTEFENSEVESRRRRILGRTGGLYYRFPGPVTLFFGAVGMGLIMLLAATLWPLDGGVGT
jgi:hypothetical protein